MICYLRALLKAAAQLHKKLHRVLKLFSSKLNTQNRSVATDSLSTAVNKLLYVKKFVTGARGRKKDTNEDFEIYPVQSKGGQLGSLPRYYE